MGLLLLREEERLFWVSGHCWREARLGECIPDVPQCLRIVVHYQDADFFALSPVANQNSQAGAYAYLSGRAERGQILRSSVAGKVWDSQRSWMVVRYSRILGPSGIANNCWVSSSVRPEAKALAKEYDISKLDKLTSFSVGAITTPILVSPLLLVAIPYLSKGQNVPTDVRSMHILEGKTPEYKKRFSDVYKNKTLQKNEFSVSNGLD